MCTASLISSTDPGELLDLCQQAYPTLPDDVPSIALLWYVISCSRADLMGAVSSGLVRPNRHADKVCEVVDFLNGPRMAAFCKALRVEPVEIRQQIAADAGLEARGPSALICLPEALVEQLS